MKTKLLLLLLMLFASQTISFAVCINDILGLPNGDFVNNERRYDIYNLSTTTDTTTVTIDNQSFTLDLCTLTPSDNISLASGTAAANSTFGSPTLNIITLSFPNDYNFTILNKGEALISDGQRTPLVNFSSRLSDGFNGQKESLLAFKYKKVSGNASVYSFLMTDLVQVNTIENGNSVATRISGDVTLRVLQGDGSYIQYEGNIDYPEDYTGSETIFSGNFSRTGEDTPVVRVGWVYNRNILCIKDINTNKVIQKSGEYKAICHSDW
mgnify:CR=1 FL=1